MKFRKPRIKDYYSDPDIVVKTDGEEAETAEAKTAKADTAAEKFGWGWRSVYILLGVSVIIFVVAVLSESFADFFNRYIGSVVRAILALLTCWLPFSLAEVLLILLIPAFFAVMIIASRWHCGSWKKVWVFSGKLVSVAAILFVLFVWSFGTGYHGSTLDKKLNIDKQPVSEEELRETADILTALVNSEAENVEFLYKDFSVMPYSVSELNSKLLDAYDKVCEQYDFIPRMYSRVKPVMLSEPMSYTHITGVYSYFTGEANINVVFPDYTIPYTAAHELAHQRGIAREDEANFVAYLVCIASDDPYIRYSAYLNMLEYVSSAYYKADSSTDHADYIALRTSLNLNVRYEQAAFSKFFDKYRDNVAEKVSGAVNDTYLQIQGTPGSVSYGLVVDLAVAYYKIGK